MGRGTRLRNVIRVVDKQKSGKQATSVTFKSKHRMTGPSRLNIMKTTKKCIIPEQIVPFTSCLLAWIATAEKITVCKESDKKVQDLSTTVERMLFLFFSFIYQVPFPTVQLE